MYLKDNSLGEDMPIVPILRAMGVQSEQEIVTMVGAEPEIVGHGGLPRGNALGIFTQEQALHFIGTKIGGKLRRALAEPLRLLLPPAAARRRGVRRARAGGAAASVRACIRLPAQHQHQRQLCAGNARDLIDSETENSDDSFVLPSGDDK